MAELTGDHDRMTKISGATMYFKVILPLVLFGFLAFFAVVVIIFGDPPAIVFPIPIALAAIFFILFRKLAWDLVDEVYDAGDHLVFRNGGVEQIVHLNEIVNINSHMTSPARVTVHVRSSGPLGKELTFTPSLRFGLFPQSRLVSELIDRVDRARSG